MHEMSRRWSHSVLISGGSCLSAEHVEPKQAEHFLCSSLETCSHPAAVLLMFNVSAYNDKWSAVTRIYEGLTNEINDLFCKYLYDCVIVSTL